MNKIELQKIGFALVCITLIFVFIFFAIVDDLPTEKKINNVDCYDRYGNKIVGQVCEQKSQALDSNYQWVIVFLYIPGTLFFIGTIFLIVGYFVK